MKRALCERARSVLPLLALAGTGAIHPAAHAQPSPLPERVRVSVQPCAALPFDAESYLAALRVELVALGVAVAEPPADDAATSAAPELTAIPELSLSSPSCDDVLRLRLQLGAEQRDTTLVIGELPTSGRERALALLSVERLQRTWPTLSAQPSTAAVPATDSTAPQAPQTPQTTPQTAPQTAPQTVSKPAPPASNTPPQPARRATSPDARTGSRHGRHDHRALGQGAVTAGLRFSAAAPLASLGLTLDRSLSRTFALGGALGWRSDGEELDHATDAHSLTAGPRAELALLELGSVELTVALGLAVGVGWVVTDRAGASDARVSSSPAPLGLATGMLGVRAVLPLALFLQTGVGADYALLGARFNTPNGRRLAELTGARFAAFVGLGARLGG